MMNVFKIDILVGFVKIVVYFFVKFCIKVINYIYFFFIKCIGIVLNLCFDYF